MYLLGCTSRGGRSGVSVDVKLGGRMDARRLRLLSVEFGHDRGGHVAAVRDERTLGVGERAGALLSRCTRRRAWQHGRRVRRERGVREADRRLRSARAVRKAARRPRRAVPHVPLAERAKDDRAAELSELGATAPASKTASSSARAMCVKPGCASAHLNHRFVSIYVPRTRLLLATSNWTMSPAQGRRA